MPGMMKPENNELNWASLVHQQGEFEFVKDNFLVNFESCVTPELRVASEGGHRAQCVEVLSGNSSVTAAWKTCNRLTISMTNFNAAYATCPIRQDQSETELFETGPPPRLH